MQEAALLTAYNASRMPKGMIHVLLATEVFCRMDPVSLVDQPTAISQPPEQNVTSAVTITSWITRQVIALKNTHSLITASMDTLEKMDPFSATFVSYISQTSTIITVQASD